MEAMARIQFSTGVTSWGGVGEMLGFRKSYIGKMSSYTRVVAATLLSVSSLYDRNAQAGDYYNTSANAFEIDQDTGVPYGFFHYPMEGFPSGYPVLFDTHISSLRVSQLLTYLQDGDYLDARMTDKMTLQVRQLVLHRLLVVPLPLFKCVLCL